VVDGAAHVAAAGVWADLSKGRSAVEMRPSHAL
jgi:hypothetical protein